MRPEHALVDRLYDGLASNPRKRFRTKGTCEDDSDIGHREQLLRDLQEPSTRDRMTLPSVPRSTNLGSRDRTGLVHAAPGGRVSRLGFPEATSAVPPAYCLLRKPQVTQPTSPIATGGPNIIRVIARYSRPLGRSTCVIENASQPTIQKIDAAAHSRTIPSRQFRIYWGALSNALSELPIIDTRLRTPHVGARRRQSRSFP